MPLHRTAALATSLLALASITLGACGDSDDGGSSVPPEGAAAEAGAGADDDVTEALEAGTPTETVEVPSEAGSTSIETYAAGGTSYEPSDPSELAQILSIVGTDADGYLTDDAVVVHSSAADATLLCETATRLDITSYRVIPVLPDGTGVDCS